MFYLFYWKKLFWGDLSGTLRSHQMDTDHMDFCSSTAQKDVSCANECQSRSKVKLMMRFDTHHLPCRRHHGFVPSKGGSQTQGACDASKPVNKLLCFLETNFTTNFTSLTTNDLTSVWLTANIYSLRWKSSGHSLIRWDTGSRGLAIWLALRKPVYLFYTHIFIFILNSISRQVANIKSNRNHHTPQEEEDVCKY